MADEVKVPNPPALLPPAEQAKWKAAYVGAFKEAQNDYPEDKPQQRQVALKEANRLLKVPEPTDFKSAMAIPAHLVIKRVHDAEQGVLKLVTIHGKKYSFDAPKTPAKLADPPAPVDPPAPPARQ